MNCQPTLLQLKAIEAPPGPVLVLSGPGAGKTFCLIHRIQHLIEHMGFAPRRILAVTFTNKAAEEIALRLHEIRSSTLEDVTRGTLHAVCLRVLRDCAARLGLQPGFGVADHEYQMGVLKRIGIPEKFRAAVLTRFGMYRLQGRPLSERGAALLARYQDRLRARNLVDFDDLVILTEQLLRTDEAAAAEIRGKWDYILVDEFQDLSPVQYAVVRRLAQYHRNLFGVGDDEQSIFSWAGSDPHIIHRFREDFGLTDPVILDHNRRCSVQIFDAARRLIARNPRLFEKQIEATRVSEFEVGVATFESEREEADWLVRDILADRTSAGGGWGNYALLYRSHRLGRYLEERMIGAGIPCRLAQGHALSDDRVVAWVIASLQVIRDPDDPVLLTRLSEHALPGALRQEIRRTSSKDRDFLTNLRVFTATRPRGDADARRVWRLIYHLENLRGLARSHQSLAGLVDELLARPVGAGRNPLEEHHQDLSDPSAYPGAASLAERLSESMAAGAPVWVEPLGGTEVPVLAMLRAAGVATAIRKTSTERATGGDLVLRADESSHGSWPLQVFKALQLAHTRTLKCELDDFVAFDLETSDFDTQNCEIVEIAAVRVRRNVPVAWFHSMVACSRPISAAATEKHGYTGRDVATAPSIEDVWSRFREFVGSDILIAHNGQEFDVPVLRRNCRNLPGLEELVFYDTLPLARSLMDGSVRLDALAQRFNVEVGRAHHALDDALMLAGVVPPLNELRLRRARKIALVQLLDQLGLALALDGRTGPAGEEDLLRDITRPYTLGRYSECLDAYSAELASGAVQGPGLDEVIARLGGRLLMERLRTERSPAERYPIAVERLRMLVEATSGETIARHVDELLCRVALSTSAEAEIDPNRVNLLTLHSTKGLEFSRVYVVGVEDQQLPGWKAIQDDVEHEIQEARRLLYVGMTRARDRLVLTRVSRRFGYPSGGSLFLIEAGLAGADCGTPSAIEDPVVTG